MFEREKAVEYFRSELGYSMKKAYEAANHAELLESQKQLGTSIKSDSTCVKWNQVLGFISMVSGLCILLLIITFGKVDLTQYSGVIYAYSLVGALTLFGASLVLLWVGAGYLTRG